MPMRFDGNNDVLNSFDAAAFDDLFTGGGSLMAWIRPESYGEADFGRIFNKSLTNTGAGGWSWFLDGSGNNRMRLIHAHSTTFGDWVTPTNSIPLNAWRHVAVTYDKGAVGNDPIFYINGVAQTLTELAAPVGTATSDAPEPFTIGNLRPNDTIRAFFGRFADARVYDRILSATEIEAVYTARGNDAILGGLIGRWPLDDEAPLISGGDLYSAGSTVTGASSTTVTVPVPIEHRNGDTMILVIASEGNTSGTPETITTPAGWTKINTGQTNLPATASTPSVHLYRRTASSEPANYVVTGNQTAVKLGTILVFKRIPATQDVISTINTGTSAAPVAPSISPSAAAVLITVCVCDDDDIVPESSVNFPATVNGRKSFEVGGVSPNGCGLLIATELVNAGATGTRTFALAASEEWGCLSVAFIAGKGQTNKYVKDVSGTSSQAFVQSAPRFRQDETLGIKRRRRAA